jgi:hypothetical protein
MAGAGPKSRTGKLISSGRAPRWPSRASAEGAEQEAPSWEALTRERVEDKPRTTPGQQGVGIFVNIIKDLA